MKRYNHNDCRDVNVSHFNYLKQARSKCFHVCLSPRNGHDPGHGSQWGLMVHMVFIHSMLVSTIQLRNIPAEYVHRVRVTSYSAAIQSTTSLHTLPKIWLHITAIRTCVWYMHCSIFNTKKIKWSLLSCNSVFLTHCTNAVIRVCKYGHELLSHVHGFDSTCISGTTVMDSAALRPTRALDTDTHSCPCEANVFFYCSSSAAKCSSLNKLYNF